MMTTTSSMEIQPDNLLLMVMNPDDLRDLWKTSLALWCEADKKIRGTDITFNELAGVMAMNRCVAQSNGVVRRFRQDRHKKKRKPLLVFCCWDEWFYHLFRFRNARNVLPSVVTHNRSAALHRQKKST